MTHMFEHGGRGDRSDKPGNTRESLRNSHSQTVMLFVRRTRKKSGRCRKQKSCTNRHQRDHDGKSPETWGQWIADESENQRCRTKPDGACFTQPVHDRTYKSRTK